MRIIRNVQAISRLFLILLLIVSAIIGALLSYVWVVGYYEALEYQNPETPSISISGTAFDPQNTSYFNLTLLYPTYSTSKEAATITEIKVSTADGLLHDVANVQPELPYGLPKSESHEFECLWNWANYTGETIEIAVSLENGSGATQRFDAPLAGLEITDVHFNSTVSISHFNLTVDNSELSVTHVNVTRIAVDTENVTTLDPYTLPLALNPGDSVSLTALWNWTDHQGKNVTITVETLQGYVAYYPEPPLHAALPSPVALEITDVLFDVSDTTHFNLTVKNSEDSPTYVTISKIAVTVENETFSDVPISPPPELPHRLYQNNITTFKCSWNWTGYRAKTVIITVHTSQGLTKSITEDTPPRVILEITAVLFNATDTSHFNVTIDNSEFSLTEFANITRISVENGAQQNLTVVAPPPLDYALYTNQSVTFKCNWNWADHWNDSVTITIYSLEGYTASVTEVTPPSVYVAEAQFNLTATDHFNIAVKNHESAPSYVVVTGITVTLENGTVQEVAVVPAASFPDVLNPGESVDFECSWSWADYRGKEVTITVSTLEGYETSYTRKTP